MPGGVDVRSDIHHSPPLCSAPDRRYLTDRIPTVTTARTRRQPTQTPWPWTPYPRRYDSLHKHDPAREEGLWSAEERTENRGDKDAV